MTSTAQRIAWAAGLFEGEGCFTVQRNKRGEKMYPQPIARIHMTDLDVLERFKEAVGIGVIFGPYTAEQFGGLGKKVSWYWQTTKIAECQVVFDMLRPWLSPRRVGQGIAVLKEREEAERNGFYVTA